MKNFLTQSKIEKKNRKIGGNVSLINKERSSNMLLMDWEFAKLKNDAECISLLKLIELVKKPPNLIKTEKEKFYYLISYSLTYFIEPIR